MQAGREMDALVAEKVMGWRFDPGLPDETAFLYPPEWNDELKAWPSTKGRQQKGPNDLVPPYSTSIAAAWAVVEKLTKKLEDVKDGEWILDRLGFRCCDADEDGVHGEWRCHFRTELNGKIIDVFETADTAPLAICLASLKAIEPEAGR